MKAQSVIDDVSDRKIKNPAHLESDRKGYIMDPATFVTKKITQLDEAAVFERAANCMQGCQLPVDIVKRVISSNVSEVEDNIKSCIQECQKVSNGSDEDNQIFSKEIYECKVICLEANKDIMNGLE